MKRWLRRLLILVGVVSVIVLLRLTVFRPDAVDVDVAAVSRGVVEDAVTNSQAGTVRSRRHSRLGAQRAGRVMDVPFREGAVVAEGALLVLLDTSTARARLDVTQRDLDASEASADAARAAFDYAQAEYTRTSSLFERKLVSQDQMDRAQSRFDTARADHTAAVARLASARANVHLAQDDLDHLRVTAPFGGVVAQRLVEIGESVVPGQPVVELVDPEALYVSARIDEIDIGRVREDMPVRVTLDPYRGQVWSGRVVKVFPVVDDRLEQNRTLEVEVDLERDPSKPQPRPGTSADVVIVVDARHDVLRVPTFAVLDGRRVLLARNGKAVLRELETGLRNWDWTEVRSGVSEGEQVITSLDRKGVHDGARIVAHAKEGVPRTAVPEAGS